MSAGAQDRMLAELERIKERAGMSFAQLQAAVPYSRSALHRYFTGQAAIPRDALVSVVRACGGDEAAMVRLWEAAQSDPALATPKGVVSAAPVGAGSGVAAAGGDSRIRATAAYVQSSSGMPGQADIAAMREPSGPAAIAKPAQAAYEPAAVAGPMHAQAAAALKPSEPVAAARPVHAQAANEPLAIAGPAHVQAAAAPKPSGPVAVARPVQVEAAPVPLPSGPVVMPEPSDTRRRALRAWFTLAFVIVAIMAIRPLIDSAPQSSADAPYSPITDQSQSTGPTHIAPVSDSSSGAVPSRSAPSPSSPAPSGVPSPRKHETSQPPASPSRDASAPPEVTIVSDQDNGRILTVPAGSIVEVALTAQWAKIKVNTDGSLISTTPPVAAPWARQLEAFVVGTSGTSTSFCAYPISRGFNTIPGSVCLIWPGNHPFNVTIVRA